MKRSLLALSVAAAIIAPAVHAAPKVYGKINIGVENYDRSFSGPAVLADVDQTEVASYASRFGIQGEDELTANLSAVYKIEWGVNTDEANTAGTGSNADLTPRDRFLGIKHAKLGTIKLGQFDSYLKSAEGSIDQFNDFKGDLEFTVAGQDRPKSVIGYESPAVAGVRFNLQAQGQEGSTKANGRNGISSSVVYDNKEAGVYAALAYTSGLASRSLVGATGVYRAGDEKESDAIRVALGYKLSDLTLGAIYQVTKDVSATALTDGREKETAYLVSAAYKVTDDNVLKAQYSVGERDKDATAGFGVNKRTATSIGLDHLLTSKTRLYAVYTLRDEEGVSAGLGYDGEEKVASVGIDHRF